MHGFANEHLALRLIRDEQERLRREAGRARLYREAKRLRAYQRTP